MHDDDYVCLCFKVTKRKIVNYCQRERPPVASLISQCLSAGTGCHWCVPFIERLHEQCLRGEANPDLPIIPTAYADERAAYRRHLSTSGDAQAADPPD